MAAPRSRTERQAEGVACTGGEGLYKVGGWLVDPISFMLEGTNSKIKYLGRTFKSLDTAKQKGPTVHMIMCAVCGSQSMNLEDTRVHVAGCTAKKNYPSQGL